jgi:hypothetical protein
LSAKNISCFISLPQKFLNIKRGAADRVLFGLLSKLPIVIAAVRRPQISVKALYF